MYVCMYDYIQIFSQPKARSRQQTACTFRQVGSCTSLDRMSSNWPRICNANCRTSLTISAMMRLLLIFCADWPSKWRVSNTFAKVVKSRASLYILFRTHVSINCGISSSSSNCIRTNTFVCFLLIRAVKVGLSAHYRPACVA